jgi:hypothetical protein
VRYYFLEDKAVKTKVLMVLVVGVLGVLSQAALVVNDASIISLYKLDEAISGQLENRPVPNVPAFYDTAPTGTAQNHDDFDDGTSNGPVWSTMPVGTGSGLVFDRNGNDRTRAAGWMNVSQGNYTEGDSFTIMARVYATHVVENYVYPVFVNGYTSGLRLQGTSVGTLNVQATLRDGTPTETYWQANSDAPSPSDWSISKDKWYNIFMIYQANTGLTVAADDGTIFKSFTNTTVPVGFDSLAKGFSDSSRHWFMGSNTTATGAYDGSIESIVLWDKALSLSEADTINLTNIPEPATICLLSLGSFLLRKRRA